MPACLHGHDWKIWPAVSRTVPNQRENTSPTGNRLICCAKLLVQCYSELKGLRLKLQIVGGDLEEREHFKEEILYTKVNSTLSPAHWLKIV